MFANEPAFKGMDAIKNVMTPSMQDPNYALSLKMDRIEVSGILAYVQGTLSHVTIRRDGKPFVDTGKFLTHLEEAGGRLLEDRRGHFQ